MHRTCLPRLVAPLHCPSMRFMQYNRSASMTPARDVDEAVHKSFILDSTRKPAASLLSSPNRDIVTYDVKPPIHLSVVGVSSLHARIGLPETVSLKVLERCLTDPSVEKDHSNHNEALSVVGEGLLEYFVGEYLCVRWPRLPPRSQLSVLWAYTGASTLARLSKEWGVQPLTYGIEDIRRLKNQGLDVSPKLLVRLEQLDKLQETMEWKKREQERQGWIERTRKAQGKNTQTDNRQFEKEDVLRAMQRFVQSVVGAVYVHSVQPPFRWTC
jgi:dsRNA-specific ribonuclease